MSSTVYIPSGFTMPQIPPPASDTTRSDQQPLHMYRVKLRYFICDWFEGIYPNETQRYAAPGVRRKDAIERMQRTLIEARDHRIHPMWLKWKPGDPLVDISADDFYLKLLRKRRDKHATSRSGYDDIIKRAEMDRNAAVLVGATKFAKRQEQKQGDEEEDEEEEEDSDDDDDYYYCDEEHYFEDDDHNEKDRTVSSPEETSKTSKTSPIRIENPTTSQSKASSSSAPVAAVAAEIKAEDVPMSIPPENKGSKRRIQLEMDSPVQSSGKDVPIGEKKVRVEDSIPSNESKIQGVALPRDIPLYGDRDQAIEEMTTELVHHRRKESPNRVDPAPSPVAVSPHPKPVEPIPAPLALPEPAEPATVPAVEDVLRKEDVYILCMHHVCINQAASFECSCMAACDELLQDVWKTCDPSVCFTQLARAISAHPSWTLLVKPLNTIVSCSKSGSALGRFSLHKYFVDRSSFFNGLQLGSKFCDDGYSSCKRMVELGSDFKPLSQSVDESHDPNRLYTPDQFRSWAIMCTHLTKD